MEIAIYIAGAAVAILTIVSAVFFGVGHRDAGLWTACAAIIAVVISGCCWYQDLLWKRDKKKTVNEIGRTVTDRSRVSVNDFRIVTSDKSDQFTYTVVLKNYGKLPARIVEQSFSYLCGATDADVPDTPVYFVVGKAGAIVYPDQKLIVNDDLWFPLLPDNGNLCAYGYFKYKDESDVIHTTGYGFWWRRNHPAVFINKPGYNYAD